MASTSSTPSVVGRFWTLPWKLKAVVIFALAAVLFLTLTAVLNALNYSVGERTGILNKLSEKGIACWTVEGQLALSNFSRSGDVGSRNETIDNTFYFSVPNSDVQKQLEAVPPGSPVTLEYHQKLFALDFPIPFLCVRRTQYEIVGVKLAPAYRSNPLVPARP
jgi:hypothetical protein